MSDLGSNMRIIRALQGDLDRVSEILEEASRWLSAKGFETQWLPGRAFRQSIRDNIDRGEVYVMKDVKGTVGTITLQWNDKKFLGRSTTRCRVHSQACDHTLSRGITSRLEITRLGSGESQSRRQDLPAARLSREQQDYSRIL